MRFKFLLPSLITVLAMFGAFLPFKTQASSPDDITVITVPENPAPNQNTAITLSSYVDDLNSVLITWSVNGKKSSSGIGDKSFSLNAPSSLGGKTTVVATISLYDGDLNETVVLKPSIMTVLWQADDSYVPPFYKGKALPSSGSEIKIVAIPEIKNGSSFVNPNNMVYNWQLDYQNQPDASGYGKDFFSYQNDYLDSSNTASVTASTLNQQNSTDGSITVTPTAPKIEFYKNDPILGTIWDQAIPDGYKTFGNETLQAAPYSIFPKDLNLPLLTFNWSINDTQTPTPIYKKYLLPLQTQTGVSGTAKISLNITNPSSLTDTASRDININF